MNDLIRGKLREIAKLREIIEKDGLNYGSKRAKTYNFGKYSFPIVFLKDIHAGYLSLEDADNKQSNFTTAWKDFDKGVKTLEKSLF